MANRIIQGATVLLATIWLGGCATEGYVDDKVAMVQAQVTANKTQLDSHEARLARLDTDTQAAMSKANEAAKLAAGKFNEDKVSEDTVLFATGAAVLSVEDQTKLSDLAARLKSDDKDVYLEIRGYTDSQGTPGFNDVLGGKRADAVYDFLASQGVPLNRMAKVSHGEDHPVGPNSSDEGRAQNRRAVIVVVG